MSEFVIGVSTGFVLGVLVCVILYMAVVDR